jgi:large subunit ribosomal protein L2
MPIKSYKPHTASRRYITTVAFDAITTSKPYKPLTKAKKSLAGRGMGGSITVRHQGGGHKRRIRFVDFRRDKFDIPAKVEAIEYDPNRSAWLARLLYRDGERRYMVAPLEIKVGAEVLSSRNKIELRVGNRMPLTHLPDGTFLYDIELQPGRGGQIVRSAGTMAQLMSHEGRYAQLKLPSGEVRNVLQTCLATIGQVSNVDHENVTVGKAGRQRWLGIRPTVVGAAMNPVDHPHGGGEGHTSIGLKKGPRTPWGKPALGVKTRRHKKRSNRLIIRNRKNHVPQS